MHGSASRLRLGIRHANLCRTLARRTEKRKKFEKYLWKHTFGVLLSHVGQKRSEIDDNIPQIQRNLWFVFCNFFSFGFLGWFIVCSIFFTSCFVICCHVYPTKHEFFTHIAMSTVFFGSQFSYQTKAISISLVKVMVWVRF